MIKYKSIYNESESNILEKIKSFDKSEESVKVLQDWLKGLNLNTGKAPSGLSKQYKNLKILNDKVNSLKQWGMNANILHIIDYYVKSLSLEDLEKLENKLSIQSKGVFELKLKNAKYINHSIISEKNFIKFSKEIDSFLNDLSGYHLEILNPLLTIVFVKKEDTKAKATYKTQLDLIYVRPDKIKSGNEYASFNYIVLHELGHRYLQYNENKVKKVLGNYDAVEWITTKYSMVDSMSGEEKFAELFALSHFNYSKPPFNTYTNTINKFVKLMSKI